MLQFITQPDERYSIPEQCQMVIEGGCEWIQLRLSSVDIADLRQTASELVPLCKETQTILLIEDHPELARELGVSGIHITLKSGLDARKVREECGPEPIIGAEVRTADRILELQDADIDYVTLSADLSDEARTMICNAAYTRGNVLPVVFEGDYRQHDASLLRVMGANGVLTGRYIMESDDPVSYTARFIKAMKEN